MSNALKKITARAKQLRKKKPNAQWKSLVKQAGREYRTGHMPKARKRTATKRKRVTGKRKYKVTHRVKKVGAVKSRRKRSTAAPRRKRAAAPKVRVVHRTRTVTKYRRVGGTKSNNQLILIAGLAAVGIVAYMVMRKKSTAPPPTGSGQLLTTGNQVRDTASQDILNYAAAIGLGTNAILAIIDKLNSMDDAAVVSAAQQPDLSINTLAALPTGGPSIHLG